MKPLTVAFSRFVVVGSVCTGFQYAILVALVEALGTAPTVASTIGFAVSAVLNYSLNYRYTFRSTSRHLTSFPRFAATALTGVVLNATIMYLGVEAMKLPYLLVQVFATALVLCWNFVVHLKWSFASSKTEQKRVHRSRPAD